MKTLIHLSWRLVGTVQVIDETANTIILGTNPDGSVFKEVTLTVPMEKFSWECTEQAFDAARVACVEYMKRFESPDLIGSIEGPSDMSSQYGHEDGLELPFIRSPGSTEPTSE